MLAVLVGVLFLGGAYRLWPEGAQVMDALRHYEGWTLAADALETMARELQNGTSLGDAVTAFCREVVSQGLSFAA